MLHPAVADAAVIGVPGTESSEILKQQIQEHVRLRLAPYQYPREIEFLDALPVTTTGKVQRRVLRERSR